MHLFETGCILTFLAFKVSIYSWLCAYSNKFCSSTLRSSTACTWISFVWALEILENSGIQLVLEKPGILDSVSLGKAWKTELRTLLSEKSFFGG